jgi:hypothetical protein
MDEQDCPTSNFNIKVGDTVIIIADFHGHGYPIDSHVVISEVNFNDYLGPLEDCYFNGMECVELEKSREEGRKQRAQYNESRNNRLTKGDN